MGMIKSLFWFLIGIALIINITEGLRIASSFVPPYWVGSCIQVGPYSGKVKENLILRQISIVELVDYNNITLNFEFSKMRSDSVRKIKCWGDD